MKRKNGSGVIRFVAVLLALLLCMGTMLPAAPTARATEGAAYGAVTVLTGAEDCTVSGSESGNTTVSNQTPVELKWSAADASVGRNQDGWWIGIKVTAPEGMTDAELQTVQYKRGNGTIGSFWSSKDSLSAPHYITLWGLINEEYLYNALNAGKHLTYQWEFDWAKSDFAEGETQIVKIDIDPENISLMSEDGTQQVYPLAGEVSVLTGPANCTITGSKRANTTISNPAPVELKWSAADASVGRYQDGWWIGIKVMAPEGMSDAELETVQYKRGNGSIGEFWKSKDSSNAPHYITLWGLINEEYLYNALNSGTHLTYQWEFDWAKSDFATGKTQIVKLDIDPQNIILKSEDGTKQVYPIFGDVSVLTGAETCVVTGNKTSSTTVETPEEIELQWYPADAAAGRYQDGWWIGIKVTAPEGMSDAELTTVKYQRGNGSIGEFWKSKDSSNAPHYITLWGLVNEEYLATALNGGTHLSYQWKFDWTGSDFAEDMTQVVTIDIDPQNIVLKKSDDASYQYPSDPLYGTLDSLTDGMAVDNSDLTHPTASSIDGGKVELLWAPKDTSIGRYQDGWWVGVKINAPEGMEYDFAAEDNNPVYYQRRVNGGEWSDRKNFNVLKDSSTAPHYLTFWMPLTEESWEANQELSYDLRFDWNRDGIYEQTMTVSCVPQDFKLMTQDGMDQVRPHTLSFEVKDGKVTVYNTEYDPGTFFVDYQGDTVTYTIYAYDNHHIVSVKEGDNTVFPVTDEDKAAVENQTQKEFTHSFTPTGDITVTAEILIDTNVLTVSVEDSEENAEKGNCVDDPLEQTIDYGSTGTISIHCAKGYIAEVQTADGTVLMTVSGKDNAVDETYTTGAITEDTELQVVFTPVEYEITYHTPVGAMPDTETYTVEDDAVSLQQLTETGFVFVGWMEKSEDGKVDGTTGSAITAMDPSECRDIDLYAVWTVDTEITAKQGDNEVISGSVTNGAEVTLTITSALEDAVYSYTCANVLGKTVDSTKGTIERTEANANVMDTFDVDYVAFDKDDVAYIYAATSTQEHGFVLWQDACKPTVVINDIWKQLWLLAQEGIRPILAYNSEKSYTLTITDNQDYDSGVAARCYAFVPYNAAVELTEDAVVEQVMEKYNLQWIEITEATTEIKNPEKNPTEGECVLILRAIDQVGNVAYADTEGMLFDNTPPKITATYNATQVKDSEEYYSNGNSVTALIRIEDEFLATSDNDESFTYSVVVNGKENIQLENPTLNRNDESIVFTGEVTFPCKPDEENQEDQEAQEEEFALTVTAMDAAGNAAEAYNATVVVDQKAPTIDVAYAYIWGGEPASASDSSDSSEDAKAKVYSNGDITATVTIRDTYLDFAQDGVTPTIKLNGEEIDIDADKITWEDGGTEWVATFTIGKDDYLGVNVLSVNVSDESGNEASYTSESLLIDTEKPTIDVAYAYTNGENTLSASDSSEGEKAKVYSNGDITATVTIQDVYLDFAQDGATPTIKLNGEEIDIDANQITWVDGGTEWVATFTISNKGVNVLSVNVSDECGNEASYTSGSLLIDTQKPTIDVSYTYTNGENTLSASDSSEGEKAKVYSNGDITATVTIRDAYLDFAQDGVTPTIKLNGKEIDIDADKITWENGGTEWVATFTISNEGDSALSINVADECGNAAVYENNTLGINSDAPKITVSYDYANGHYESGRYKVEGDNGSLGHFANGNITVTVKIEDDYLDSKKDGVKPTIELNGTEIELEADKIKWENGETEWTAEFEIPYTENSYAEYNLKVLVSDESGNPASYNSGVLRLDTIAPEIESVTIRKSQSALDKVLNFLTFGIFFNGNVEVEVSIKDDSINANSNDYPKEQVSQVTLYLESNGEKEAFTQTTDEKGIAIFTLSDENAAMCLTKDVAAIASFTAMDAAGNTCEEVQPTSYVMPNSDGEYPSNVLLYETTAPGVSFTGIKENTYCSNGKYWAKSDSELCFDVYDNASGLNEVQIALMGPAGMESTYGTYQNGKYIYNNEKCLTDKFKITYNNLSIGLNVIKVTSAVDNAGNAMNAEQSFDIYCDDEAAKTTFSADTYSPDGNKLWVKDGQPVEFNVTDLSVKPNGEPSGIQTVSVTVATKNGKTVEVTNDSGNIPNNGEFTFETQTFEENFTISYGALDYGENIITVKVVDNVGNVSEEVRYTIYKDDEAAKTIFSADTYSPDGNKLWVKDGQPVEFNVTDLSVKPNGEPSGIQTVSVTVATKNGKTVEVTNDSGNIPNNGEFTFETQTFEENFTISYGALDYGENIIAVKVVDSVGNVSEEVQYTIYKDDETAKTTFSAETYTAAGEKEWLMKGEAVRFTVEDKTEKANGEPAGIQTVMVAVTTPNNKAVKVTNNNGTVADNGVFNFDSQTWHEGFMITYDAFDVGENRISVVVTDNVGNQSETIYIVYKDTTAPTISGIKFKPAPTNNEGDANNFIKPTIMQYGFYFNSDTVVTICASDDASGMNRITYYTVDFLGEASERETLSVDNDNSISFIVKAGFKGQIFACPTDNVGNLPMDQNGEPSFTAPDGTVLETQDQHDKIADASIVRDLTPVSEKDHAGYPLYSGDVPLTITVSDDFAGLREVEWSVKLDETTIESGKVSVDNDGKITSTGGSAVWSGTKNKDDNLVPMLVGKLTVSKEGTGITVYVKLTDRAGNTTEKEEKFSIDRTKPTWNVSYNTPAQTSGGTDYHSSPVTATIRVTELNFDADDFQVKVNGAAAAISGWQQNGTVWTTTVTMSRDGEYIFEVTGEDMAKNVMDPYKSNKKIVDQTAPVCDVTFNQEVQTLNENAYHDGPVTATIRITEQNFNPNDFRVTVNGAAAQITGWAQNGTVWTTSVTMSEDGEYVFEVTGADMARNALTPYKSNTRIVDATKPAIVLDGIKNESANNADTIGFTLTVTDVNILDSDIAPKLTVVNWTGKGIEPASFPEETIQLEKTSATADGQTIYTYTVKNLEKDGFYTLVCTAKDLSGNTFSTILVTDDAKEADTVYFSVNRDGSVFWLETEHTDKYADGKVLHNELFGAYANDTVKVILHEVNVDEVNLKDATKPSKFTVSNGSLTTEVELVEGENYEKNSRIGAGGWYENTYTLNNDLFAEDGSYSVNLLTYDRAGNSNTNTKEEDGRMQFVVDRTDPVISSNAKTDQRINASDYMLEFNITETNLAEETLAVKINGEPVSTENLIAVGGNTYQYQLTDGLNQTVEIYAKDKAGNESGVYRIDSLTISTNVIVLWYANTPLFWGSIGGVAALTALIAWLIIAKKRKQEKQEA
ncbi:MAG: InlB B-repeat-containing protein [Faecousia sp.]